MSTFDAHTPCAPTPRTVTLRTLQNEAITEFNTLITKKNGLKNLPTFASEIPDEEIWCKIRALLLSEGRCNEEDAERLAITHWKSPLKNLPTTVFHALREQIVVETKQISKLAYDSKENVEYIWIKIKTPIGETTDKKDEAEVHRTSLLLLEVSLLRSSILGKEFYNLSSSERAPLLITDQ